MKALTTTISFTALATTLALSACSKTEPEPTSNASATATVESKLTPAGSTTAATATAAPAASGPRASTIHPALLDPSKASEKAPSEFKAKFTTTKGDFVVDVHRDWAPNGADRFYNLVKLGYFDDTRFFRAVDNFMVQFGISGDPAVNAKWASANISDDPVKGSNKKGFVTFAQTNM